MQPRCRVLQHRFSLSAGFSAVIASRALLSALKSVHLTDLIITALLATVLAWRACTVNIQSSSRQYALYATFPRHGMH